MCTLGSNYLPGQSFCTRPFQLDTINWHGNPPLVRFFDNSGREYDGNVLIVPPSPISDDICVVGMFTLHFLDVGTPFFFDPHNLAGTGWNSPATLGELRKTLACQVFQDISDFIGDINPGNPGRVHIRLSNQQGNFSMLADAIFAIPSGVNNLVVDGEVYKTIVTGNDSYLQYPNLAPMLQTGNLFHAFISVNDADPWHYNPDTPIPANEYDFYGVMLHEALHCLGIIDYQGPPIPFMCSRFYSNKQLNTLPPTPMVSQPGGAGVWQQNVPTPPQPTVCDDPNSVFFQGQGSGTWQEVVDGPHLGCPGMANFTACPPAPPFNDFVMSPCVDVGNAFNKRHPNEVEKDILCDLGYTLNAFPPNGLPVFGTDQPNSPFVLHEYLDMCEPMCNVAGVSDFVTLFGGMPEEIFPLANDINGSNAILTQLVLHTQGAGWISGQTATSFTFQPNGNFTGWVVLSYVPGCTANNYVGAATFIFLFLNNCDCPPGATVYQAGTPGATTTLSTTTLMPSIPPGSCVQVEGTLNIDIPYAFPPGVRLIMGAGSRIDVHRDLTFSPQSNLYACDQMWQGIHVWKGVTLQMEGVLVEDADNAVWAHNNTLLNLTDNRFHANHVGLMFYDAGGIVNTQLLSFDGNLFDCTGTTLLPPYPANTVSRAGIGSEGYDLFITKTNTFRDMRNGIISNRGNLYVGNCLFQRIRHNLSPGTLDGIGISQFTGNGSLRTLTVHGDNDGGTLEFDDCRVGVWAVRQHTNLTATDMRNVDAGLQVLLSHNSSHRVAFNHIACNNVGIDFWGNNGITSLNVLDNVIDAGTPTSTADAGIRMQLGTTTSNNLRIIGNTVNQHFAILGYSIGTFDRLLISDNVANLSGTTPSTGYYLANSPFTTLSCNRAEGAATNDITAGIVAQSSLSSNIQCNHTLNTRWGMMFADYTSPGLLISGNTLGNHDIGLQYASNVTTLPQSLQGNLWTGTYGTAGAVHIGAFPFTNVYEVSTVTATPICPPTVMVGGNTFSIGDPFNPIPNSFWFVETPGPDFDCAVNNIVCAPSIDALVSDGGSGNYDSELLAGNIPYEVYPTESEWAAKRVIYGRILGDSTMLQDSMYAAFFDAYQDSSLGRFETLSHNLAEGFAFSPVTQQQLDNLQNGIQILLDSLAHLDSLTQLSQDTTQLQAMRLLRTEIHALEQQQQALLQGLDALRDNLFGYLQTENGLLPNTETYEWNEQVVNGIWMEIMGADSLYFTPAQIADLENIANQCPLSGGKAVYIARSLYSAISGNTYYDDQNICAQAGLQLRKAQEGKKPGNSPDVYPNPADRTISLKWEAAQDYSTVSLVNALGRVVLSQQLPTGSRGTDLHTESIPEGVYYLLLSGNVAPFYSTKIVISHP